MRHVSSSLVLTTPVRHVSSRHCLRNRSMKSFQLKDSTSSPFNKRTLNWLFGILAVNVPSDLTGVTISRTLTVLFSSSTHQIRRDLPRVRNLLTSFWPRRLWRMFHFLSLLTSKILPPLWDQRKSSTPCNWTKFLTEYGPSKHPQPSPRWVSPRVCPGWSNKWTTQRKAAQVQPQLQDSENFRKLFKTKT